MSLYFKDVSIFLSTFLQIELCAEARGFEWSPDACVGLVGARGASDSGGKGQDGWRDARGQGRRGRLSCLKGPGGEGTGSDTLTQACRPEDSGFPTGEPAAEGPREMKVAGPWPSSRPLSLGSSVDTITVLPCVLLENKCL